MSIKKSKLMSRRQFTRVKVASELEEAQIEVFAKNASASMTIDRFNMWRVAGNVYECPSTQDFWEVKEGKLKRLTSNNVVDNGESLVAANKDNPELSLKAILDDLDF